MEMILLILTMVENRQAIKKSFKSSLVDSDFDTEKKQKTSKFEKSRRHDNSDLDSDRA